MTTMIMMTYGDALWNDDDDNDWWLNWTELNWTELNWTEVKWSELNNDWWLNWTESKKSNDLLECVQPRQIASRSSIDWIGLETESEWNYIVRSCIIRNTTQNQGSSIISCIEVQLAMAQYDCHPPGVLKCSYQLRKQNSNMLQQLFIISCIEV